MAADRRRRPTVTPPEEQGEETGSGQKNQQPFGQRPTITIFKSEIWPHVCIFSSGWTTFDLICFGLRASYNSPIRFLPLPAGLVGVNYANQRSKRWRHQTWTRIRSEGDVAGGGVRGGAPSLPNPLTPPPSRRRALHLEAGAYLIYRFLKKVSGLT